MRTDNVLRCDAMNLLIKGLGEVETERFIYLVKREHFDYTEWQRTLWDDLSIDEVYKLAADHEQTQKIMAQHRWWKGDLAFRRKTSLVLKPAFLYHSI